MKYLKIRRRTINLLLIIAVLFVLVGCGEEALTEWGKMDLFEKFLVFPVGWLLKTFSILVGGYYVFGIFVTTILVRTAGWPIYTKTNDMSLKMQLMQPEMTKVQEKYADRKDPDSQRMMQFEMAGLYKKYGIGFGGCLLPFLQFPIFMSIFYAIQMMSKTTEWRAVLNDNIFGVHLFATADWKGTFFSTQNIGIIVLAILVTVTQVISQVMMLKRQKKTQSKAQADIPEYRRAAQTQQQMQMQKTTQIMLYVMTGMMALFVIQSPAALGLYWLIGNVYSTAQTVVNEKFSEKRMLKLKQQHNVK